MAKPQRDECEVNACLEHVHGRTMSNDVRGNLLPFELWATCRGAGDSKPESIGDARPSHWTTSTVGEEPSMRIWVDLA